MNSDTLTMPVTLLGLALLLAVLIERVLEIVRCTADYFEAKAEAKAAAEPGYVGKWTKKAIVIRNSIELRLDAAKTGDPQDFNLVMRLLTWYINKNDAGGGGAFVISADKIRMLTLKVRYKAIAVVLGVAFALLLQIDVLELVQLSQMLAAKPELSVVYAPKWYGMLLAGIAMGFGAGPLHKIISALEKARKGRAEPES
jgi:hypothetical protein